MLQEKHKNKKGQSWSRARSSRTRLTYACVCVWVGWTAMIFFSSYVSKNIPINMHATAINNYARDQKPNVSAEAEAFVVFFVFLFLLFRLVK